MVYIIIIMMIVFLPYLPDYLSNILWEYSFNCEKYPTEWTDEWMNERVYKRDSSTSYQSMWRCPWDILMIKPDCLCVCAKNFIKDNHYKRNKIDKKNLGHDYYHYHYDNHRQQQRIKKICHDVNETFSYSFSLLPFMNYITLFFVYDQKF